MRSGRRKLVAGVVAIAALAVAVGCGGKEQDPDLINGKALFVQKCASCHTLARANAKGVQGPNLDAAFTQSRQDGLGEQTIVGVVHRQIANVRTKSIMPRNLVTGQDARDVAAYVGDVAGQGGKDQGLLASAGAPKISNKPVVAKAGTLTIDADPSGALAFNAKFAQAGAGSVQFDMDNQASIQHNIAVASPDGKLIKEGAKVGKGGVSKFTADLKPGKYEFLCTVPGHAAGGMKGTLTVK